MVPRFLRRGVRCAGCGERYADAEELVRCECGQFFCDGCIDEHEETCEDFEDFIESDEELEDYESDLDADLDGEDVLLDPDDDPDEPFEGE